MNLIAPINTLMTVICKISVYKTINQLFGIDDGGKRILLHNKN